MEAITVKEFICKFGENLDSPLWQGTKPVSDKMPLKIDRILSHDSAFARYIVEHPEEVTDFQLNSILNMLHCVRDECGGITFVCPDCGQVKYIPFRCHSRVCARCGKKYAEEWGRELMNRFLNVDHRHVIYTLPDALWPLVESDPGLYVNDMFDAAKAVISHLFKDKFGLFPVEFGMIVIIHFSGRDMKYNPHIHALVTEGGLSKKGIWHRHSFWPYPKMNSYWKYEVLKRFAYHSKNSYEKRAIIDAQRKCRFPDGTDGFVVKNYPGVMNVKDFGRYLARYVRHPPIGESRILWFDGKDIGIKYEWDNQIFETSISIEKFIAALLANIPPKGFSEVRQYGLYCNLHYSWSLAKIQGFRFEFTTLIKFAPGMIKNGLPCSNCKGRMEPAAITYIRAGCRVEIVF